jgi:biotin carboxyl carrier protein
MPVYHVTVGDKTYTVEVPNPQERPVRAIVDGEVIEVAVAEAAGAPSVAAVTPMVAAPVAAPVAPRPAPAAVGASDVRAPLPGTIIKVAVKAGDQVQAGQELMVLEAMKMNNPIKATRAGKIAEVFVTKGQKVQHGDPLLKFED